MVNIGLIGCGGVANGHMQAFQNIKNARVVAVSDIASEKAKVFAERHKIDKYFSDYRNLLEIKDLDFVDICTPTSTHAPLVCEVAKSGHNVLVEKPMARSTAECDQMLFESKKNGVKLCVCHNQKFFPSIRQAKSLVDSGSYDLVSFRTSVKESPSLIGAPNWNVTSKEKGILWEAGCHLAYLQLHFLGDITEVYSFGNKVRYPVYDDLAVLLRTPTKSYGIMELSWLAKQAEVIYEIDSADGKRAQIDANSDIFTEMTGATANVGLYSEFRKVLRYFLARYVPRSKTQGVELGYFIGHYHLISEYIKSLDRDKSPPVSPEEGKKAIQLLECIEQSLDTHKAVRIK